MRSGNPQLRRALIFLHIPKTAGRTLHFILDRQYNRREIFHIDGSSDVGVREARYINLPEEQRVKIRLLKGHILFGLHEFVPNPFTYITVLRNPIDRVISHYYYVKRSPFHPLYRSVVSEDMSLEEYVSSGISLELDNSQVRTLIGHDHRKVAFGECSRDMLERAQNNLRDHFSVVGIAERFDETLILMKRALGWKSFPLYNRKNVTKNRPPVESVSKHVLCKIERNHELDIELYEWATKSFDEALSRDQDEIREELARFQVLNSMYAKCMYPINALHSSLIKVKRLGVSRARPQAPEANGVYSAATSGLGGFASSKEQSI